jgi:hypothetical protein
MRTGLAALLLLVPTSLFAWGQVGHKVTADVAERQLGKSSPALKEALKILGVAHLAEVATKADDLRNVVGTTHTAEWHFVDIPIDQSAFDASRDCALSDCIITRIDQFRTVLADPKQKPKQRQEALLYLIHFIGDVHQPLHCETGRLPDGSSDRGGNLIHVTVDGDHVPGNDNEDPKNDNLHFLWDVSLIEWEGLGETAFVNHLFNETLNGRDPSTLDGGTTLDWAMESHAAAQEAQVADKTDLDDTYMDNHAEVADERLLLGGLRLARVIKSALTP